jgi:hypothetical protein
MPTTMTIPRLFVLLCLVLASGAFADQPVPAFSGTWVLNEDLSDDIDLKIEKAIKKAGGKIKRGKKTKGRYRGGPPDQEIYDHVAYDELLKIEHDTQDFQFIYPDNFIRQFSIGTGGRVVSASGSNAADDHDFSFAYWDGLVLVVESRPRDGGRITERYTLLRDSGQLQAELYMEPLKFPAALDFLRIFDPAGETDAEPDSGRKTRR